MRAINEIIIHCADTPNGKEFHAKDIDAWHRERGWLSAKISKTIFRMPALSFKRVMLAFVHYLKVVYGVVEPIVIQVMHNLIPQQLATYMGFHHISMFVNIFAVNAYASISISSDNKTTVPAWMAFISYCRKVFMQAYSTTKSSFIFSIISDLEHRPASFA